MDFPFTGQQIEEIVNWTLPGLTMYYRDADLSTDIIEKYEAGKIFRSQTFVDVSSFAGRLTKNCRFIIATNKAASLYQINPDTDKWKLHTINANSYFKVLDIYKKGDQTQLFLLHIPAQGIEFFRNTVLKLGGNNLEEQLIGKARTSLDQKMEMAPVDALEEFDWVNRTAFPIGLDHNNEFFSINPTGELYEPAVPLYNAIVKMTKDTALNVPTIIKPESPKEERGFWKRLFG